MKEYMPESTQSPTLESNEFKPIDGEEFAQQMRQPNGENDKPKSYAIRLDNLSSIEDFQPKLQESLKSLTDERLIEILTAAVENPASFDFAHYNIILPSALSALRNNGNGEISRLSNAVSVRENALANIAAELALRNLTSIVGAAHRMHNGIDVSVRMPNRWTDPIQVRSEINLLLDEWSGSWSKMTSHLFGEGSSKLVDDINEAAMVAVDSQYNPNEHHIMMDLQKKLLKNFIQYLLKGDHDGMDRPTASLTYKVMSDLTAQKVELALRQAVDQVLSDFSKEYQPEKMLINDPDDTVISAQSGELNPLFLEKMREFLNMYQEAPSLDRAQQEKPTEPTPSE